VYYPDHRPHRPHPAVQEDRVLHDRVWAALRSDRYLDSRGLSVGVAGGVVTVGGYAPNIGTRDRALYTASRVPGVRSVVNQMTLN
jgi:osmotically-inducible protein OsmY